MELGPENQAVRKLWLGVLAGLGRNDEAIGVARDGLAAFPYNPNLHYMLGLALARKGDFVAATNQFVYALLNKPDWAEVHLAFGRALLNLGDVPAGLRHFQEAARLAPDSPPALNELAWLLATGADAALRNGPEAVRLAEHACAVTNRRNPTLLDTLAAAYAEAGRFPQAVSTAQEASSLARTTGNEATVVQTDNLLGLFQSGRPFHQKPAPAP
jgi:tetratricopeptide (TPR) repeat protein